MWEIFDQANYSTKNFEDLFSAIFAKMEDIFDEEGFASDVEELSENSDSSLEGISAGHDSAHEEFIDVVSKVIKHNIFSKATGKPLLPTDYRQNQKPSPQKLIEAVMQTQQTLEDDPLNMPMPVKTSSTRQDEEEEELK